MRPGFRPLRNEKPRTMKTFSLIFIGLWMCLTATGQNWITQVPGTGSDYFYSVSFLSGSDGYAVGYDISDNQAVIAHTINGGAGWTIERPGPLAVLRSVCTPDSNVTYAVGTNGTILKRTGAGGWISQYQGPPTYYFTSCYFVDDWHGYVVGKDNVVLKTTDGGLHWNNVTGGLTGSSYWSVFFTSVDTGYVVGGYTSNQGILLQTTDGGASWTSQMYSAGTCLYSVCFPEKNVGYAVGMGGTIIKTVNGGDSWLGQYSGTGKTLNSVSFPTANTGYIVANGGTLLNTIDGGATWTWENSGTLFHLHSVYFPNADTGFVAGENGIELKTMNGGGVGMQEKQKEIPLNLYPDPATDKIVIECAPFPGKAVLLVSDVNGRECIQKDITSAQLQLDISALPAGVYFVRLTGEKTVQAGKFVKQ